MAQFQIGDIVRRIRGVSNHQMRMGGRYTVTGISESSRQLAFAEVDGQNWLVHNFELVSRAGQVITVDSDRPLRNKFKVGDRIKLIANRTGYAGQFKGRFGKITYLSVDHSNPRDFNATIHILGSPSEGYAVAAYFDDFTLALHVQTFPTVSEEGLGIQYSIQDFRGFLHNKIAANVAAV